MEHLVLKNFFNQGVQLSLKSEGSVGVLPDLGKEQRLMLQIEQWEKREFTYEPNDFSVLYQYWIEQMTKGLSTEWLEGMNRSLDRLVFHLHALIQNAEWQTRAREQLLLEAQTLSPDIETIEDLRRLPIQQLMYMAEKHIAKNRLLSTLQGGVTGTGGFLFLSLDLPFSVAIQMHAIQLISLSYGEDVRVPGALMTSLNLFQLPLLPKGLQYAAWRKIEEEAANHSLNPHFFDDEEGIQPSWLSGSMRQLGKTLFLQQLKKKWVQGVPLIGMAAGAMINYKSTKRATEIAHKFYQKQHLLKKLGEKPDEPSSYEPW